MGAFANKAMSAVCRKKHLETDILATQLRRCLSIFDVTMLGLGMMIGAGIYVLTGTVARSIAGPGVFLCYLFSGLAALFSALCYAEFGARVPKAGSAYTYTYVTVGEVWAFIIGWNMILEYILAGASVARALSGTIDAISSHAISNWSTQHLGEIHLGGHVYSIDLIAFGSTYVVMGLILVGAKTSVSFNNLFTSLSLIVLVFIICMGFSHADIKNWTSLPTQGDFLPYGVGGVFSGAATCFYAYVGFEGIAIAGEETRNPSRAIPIAMCVTMLMATVLYVCCSATLTLMVPFFDVNVSSPYPDAFATVGLRWAMYVVALGALFGIITSLLGALYALPRAVYSMANDGLLFRWLAYIHPRTQTPIWAILTFGTIMALMALLVDIQVLVEFLSIGTLLSFAMVSGCVIVLRYQTVEECQFQLRPEATASTDGLTTDDRTQLSTAQNHDDIGKLKKRFRDVLILKDVAPGAMTTGMVVGMGVCMAGFSAALTLGFSALDAGAWWAVILLVLPLLGICGCFCVLLLYEQNTSFCTFQVPLVPLFPAISMFINLLLMTQLHYQCWIRLAVWIAAGMCIYVAYGVSHSNENKPLAIQGSGLSYNIENGASVGATLQEPDSQPSERTH